MIKVVGRSYPAQTLPLSRHLLTTVSKKMDAVMAFGQELSYRQAGRWLSHYVGPG